MMELPTGVPVSPRSFMMGTSVPNAVVVMAMATAMPSSWAGSNHGSRKTTTKPSASEMPQAPMPRLPSWPTRFLGLISMPASRNRYASPSSERKLTTSVVWITPSRLGPNTAPAMSRNTDSGMSLLGMRLAMMGQSAATTTMTASEMKSTTMECASFGFCSAGACGARAYRV